MDSDDFVEQFPPRPRLSSVKDGRHPGGDRLQGLTDAELVARTQEGDVAAFNQLAGRWESSLYGFVRRTLGDAEEARDDCQEARVKSFQNIRKLRDGGKFKSWVHYIALNLCRDRFRTARAKATMLPYEEGGPEDLEGPNPGAGLIAPDQAAEATSLTDILASLLEELPAEQRNSILLREYQGFTSEEIGEITGVPAATVRTRIYYGLRTLRKTMKERGLDREDFA